MKQKEKRKSVANERGKRDAERKKEDQKTKKTINTNPAQEAKRKRK